METIKAIETEYAGYKFRSRLEARYAIYFDALGIKWRYETEGFELPSGRYLPDFYFIEHGVYGEIKPYGFTGDERHIDFVKTGMRLFIFIDVPGMVRDRTLYFNQETGNVTEITGTAFPDNICLKHGDFYYGDLFLDDFPAFVNAVRLAKTAQFDKGPIKRPDSYWKSQTEVYRQRISMEFDKMENLLVYRTLPETKERPGQEIFDQEHKCEKCGSTKRRWIECDLLCGDCNHLIF